ncbi:McrB family protein [Chryseobacterium sp. TY3]
MTENLKNITYQLIEKYIDILEENGEPNETYKYLAINTFQQNWDLEAEDFYQMFRSSFSKVSNLLYQNSWGFIEKSTQLFPEEVREMFRNLYDESLEISQRIKIFQTESENILPKVRQSLNRTNINTQQDERTISVYLAFRFPEKYMLYKADYYKNFCELLNIKAKKSGERFLHLQELANQIIQENLLSDNNFINTHRKFYQKPDWDDKYLMIQNVLYVVFREAKDFNLIELFKKFDKKQLEEYYDFLDSIIENFGLQENDKRLVFNSDKNKIVFTIGQRYIWNTATIGKDDYKFRTISEQKISNNFVNFDGSPTAYLCKLNDISEAQKNKQSVFNSIENELNRTQISVYSKYNKKELERMAFDIDFRNEILSQLEYQTTTEKPMENINSDKKIPLNQILFGAPGTGKTYNTKRIAVEIVNGKKQRTREEINTEYENLVNAKQIVFTTFHQSLSYEDFIEGIKPETIDGNVTYEIKDGIFKSLCKTASLRQIDSDNFDSVYQKLLNEIDKSSEKKLVLETIVHSKEFSIYRNSKNNIRFHANTEKASEGVIKKDVIEHYLKTGETLDWAPYTKALGNYLVEHYNYSQNENNEQKSYVIIIDEINRGNVSAIFGELITLLEEDKRKGNKEQTEVILPYSNDKFSVPNNVYIIGTMNTADRSVEALDTALRRRFSFFEIQPNPSVLLNSEYQDVDLKQLLETINQRIEVLVDKDHQIGHSYFIGIQNLDDLKQTFKDKIIPLLEEYFYGDFGKIGLVLGGSFIYQEENKAKFPKNFSYENDFLEDKKVYRFTPFENWDEQTFISVYED